MFFLFANKNIIRSGMFGKAFKHDTHHRGQTTIYLRLKAVTPPGEMLFWLKAELWIITQFYS
jgi:DinB family